MLYFGLGVLVLFFALQNHQERISPTRNLVCTCPDGRHDADCPLAM